MGKAVDRLTREQRHKNMSHIRSHDTEIELLLRKALWQAGIRYRKNYAALPGKPDIAITKYKVAIFCDGEFFRGKDWPQLRENLNRGNNPRYWIPKIERNIDRDNEVDKSLNALGWTVLRFWGKDIKEHTNDCVGAVKDAIFQSSMVQDFE